ncbi:MAG: FkbM family methyltransferase [Candidatus Magasanikbacteria bacterium GW2011_GWA2_46_17]|uniref:FkbM family methyltransferase n=1 Tax=Candidatus Magasanikbacteria bacterium GW2011_GWA2_46_17 TaxID=1619042 RepID=A0A0G1P102_9BACT|nr:MAG: FkbM family methyltransferase [Candidatus Magasanikbacteria bacterium GW2011_GWA2_46_17]
MQTIIKQWTLTFRDDADQSVAAEIFKRREYRAADEVIHNAKHPIIDAGAHAGFFSLYCRSLNPEVKIYALEPEPNNFEHLNKYLRLNNVTNVHPLQLALAAETGERELYLSTDSHNHSLVIPAKAGIHVVQTDEVTTVLVHTLTLNDLCNQYKISVISVLKMDIEGAEYEVIESLTPKDLAKIGSLILEYHNNANNNYKNIEQTLRQNGFSVQIFPSKFDKTMGFIFALNKSIKLNKNQNKYP